MATVAALGTGLASTSNAETYAHAAVTPAADALIVAHVTATVTVDVAQLTSDVGGDTYSLVESATFVAGAHTQYVFVADQLATNVSQVLTFDCTGDAATGCVIQLAAISGMSKVGLDAVAQSKPVSNQSGGTPAVTFDAAPDSGNPVTIQVSSTDNTNINEPSGMSLLLRNGYGTPTMEQTSAYDDSGAATTLTWASSTGGDWASIAVEWDASAPSGAQPRMLAQLGVGL